MPPLCPPARTFARALTLLSLLAGSFGALAGDAPGTGPCRDDARTLCAAVQPGGGRAVACLKQHEADLSPGCQAALPTIEHCVQEVQSLCSVTGRRALRSCLRENANKLSPECQRATPQR
jgi:hypothetical protein